MYQMKKGGSAKSPKQQAAIAISMKASGKKPKMGMGGMHMMPDGTMMKNSMMKKGGSIGTSKKPKMAMGGSLKPVDSSKNPGLSKLPTEVRNKMGYQKMGGSVKSKKK
jgi:hypothetical protein